MSLESRKPFMSAVRSRTGAVTGNTNKKSTRFLPRLNPNFSNNSQWAKNNLPNLKKRNVIRKKTRQIPNDFAKRRYSGKNKDKMINLPFVEPNTKNQLQKNNNKTPNKLQQHQPRKFTQLKKPVIEIIQPDPVEPIIEQQQSTEKKASGFGFGVAFRISKLLGKLHSNRSNSAEKLHTVPEYSHSMDTINNEETNTAGGLKRSASDNPIFRRIALEKSTNDISAPKTGNGCIQPEHEIISPPGTVPENVNEDKPPIVTVFRSARPFSSRLSGLSINRSSASSMRDSVMSTQMNIQHRFTHQNNWGFLRNRLVQAKMSDVFSNIRFTVNGSNIRALRCIGEGGYSKVYEVFDDSNELLALKVVKISDDTKVKDELMAEIKILKELKDCERVIDMIDYELKEDIEGLPFLEDDNDENENEPKTYLFLLLERGEIDLDDVIKNLKKENNFSTSKMRFYWEQMLEAVEEVHARGIIHADIKPANFVLVKGRLKIIDFGLAIKMQPGENSSRRSMLLGTKDFLSPETFSCYIIEDGVINTEAMNEKTEVDLTVKVDIWALGIILYQWVYNDKHPYASLPGGKLTRIKALTTLDVPINLDSISDPMLYDTIRLCLEKRIEIRPNAQQLLKHPYLNPVTM